MGLLLKLILLGLEVESIFFFGWSCWGGVFGQNFLKCPSPLFLLLFKLWDVSIGVLMEESFVGVFCMLAFLVRVVSLGAGDAGSSGLVGFFGVGGLEGGALGSSSGFLECPPFFFRVRPSIFRTWRVFMFRGWV